MRRKGWAFEQIKLRERYQVCPSGSRLVGCVPWVGTRDVFETCAMFFIRLSQPSTTHGIDYCGPASSRLKLPPRLFETWLQAKDAVTVRLRLVNIPKGATCDFPCESHGNYCSQEVLRLVNAAKFRGTVFTVIRCVTTCSWDESPDEAQEHARNTMG